MMKNKLCSLLQIKFPVIQAGMVWCSGWELASAVSAAGGLGTIGSGSMYPDQLITHIKKCKEATDQPFAVNIPLMYPQIDEHIRIIKEHKVPIVISSAGNPKTFTEELKADGIRVLHVVSNSRFAIKAAEAGVDAIIGEGFEAGGHNGREETTTLCLIPQLKKLINIPLVAAGGIASGEAMAACLALGADGVQVGSRFVNSLESSAHQNFKEAVAKAKEGDTLLTLKELTPVRLLKNHFFEEVMTAYQNEADADELRTLLGRGRAKKGMFEGDMDQGELEIGQVSALISDIQPAAEILNDLVNDCRTAISSLSNIDW